MHRILRRCALIAATALAAGLLTAPPAQAAGPSPTTAADWLATQLTGGLVHNEAFDYDDYGLTVDVAFAHLAVVGLDPVVAEIDTALRSHVGAYVGRGKEVYAGPTAKLAVFAQALGANPRSYGGKNLVRKLNRRVSTRSVVRGRIRDRSQYGDYANVIGQAFAARALRTAGSGKAPDVLRFLLRQQCREGYFRLDFTSSKRTRDQGCNAGDPATTSAPDTDATAVAVLQLQAMTGKHRRIKRAIHRAARWLREHQKPNGAFKGGSVGANTNSTGLAGWALGATGFCGAAQDAAEWVGKRQVVDATGPLTGQLGAIAYDRAAFAAGQTAGITADTSDQWRRATAQAAPALTNLVRADCTAR